VVVVGDKQPYPWAWVPGSTTVTRDQDLVLAPLPVTPETSCCAATPGPWGNPVKRQKAAETCLDHGVSLGSPIPWLKMEGAASTTRGLWLAPNMGFDCAENASVLHVVGGEAPGRPVPGLTRHRVLEALGATDLRLEGFGMAPDGSAALLGVRQVDTGQGDRFVRQVVVSAPPGGPGVAVDLATPAGTTLADGEAGLSDVAVMQDTRVAVTVSVEKVLGGQTTVSGELWLSPGPRPWAGPSPWAMQHVASFPDHKPEVVVQLGPRCVAVLFDDDERYKAQHRTPAGNPAWDAEAAFVSYVTLP
jgi:hypothetical protein